MKTKTLTNLMVMAITLVMPLTTFCQSGKASKKGTDWRYEIEPAGVGTQGSYLIKVWSYDRKVDRAVEKAKMNAVHGVIFRGFNGSGGIPSQKPLVREPNLEQTRDDFFSTFFRIGGDFERFVTITNDGSIAPQDRLKVGREYKIGVIVSVNKDELRKFLEDKGIISRLGDRF